ncbi:MAG TPA: hypothetical protein VGD67_10810, partial [Pseudonocardiaceae bacterium]
MQPPVEKAAASAADRAAATAAGRAAASVAGRAGGTGAAPAGGSRVGREARATIADLESLVDRSTAVIDAPES